MAALFADGLQISSALANALVDPVKWREFWIYSSLAAAVVVGLATVAIWRGLGVGWRALAGLFVLANIAFVIVYTHSDEVVAASPPSQSSEPAATTTLPPTNVQLPTTTTNVSSTTSSLTPQETHTTPAPASWTVSAATSRDPNGSPFEGKVNLRFWAYQSGTPAIGDIRYIMEGSSGKIGWSPTGTGKDCTFPYATYVYSGVPAGTYQVSVFIPDIDGLAHSVQYNGAYLEVVLNQEQNRGQWVQLPNVESTDHSGAYSVDITVSHPPIKFDDTPGCSAGTTRIAYDAIRITKVEV